MVIDFQTQGIQFKFILLDASQFSLLKRMSHPLFTSTAEILFS